MNFKKLEVIPKTITAFAVICAACANAPALITGTPHDLSAVGDRNPCHYCHTPHGSLSNTPSWNHELSKAVYRIYQSSSLDAKVGQPTGTSKLCLSCHDGTVALTATVDAPARDGAYIAPGAANLGTDLSDDHPISFVYSDGLSAEDPKIRPASSLPEFFKLDRSDELQCTTCHDPHDNKNGDFLVLPNDHSIMCVTCHELPGWTGSSHEASSAPSTGANDSYLRNSKYSTVSENGCLSCHRPHSAGGHERLLHFPRSEDNCLNCHDGSVAQTNLRVEFSKSSRHNVMLYEGEHDLKEIPTAAPRHVECVDCHNPHGMRQDADGRAPAAYGAIERTTGITAAGSMVQEVQYEYELCFKCHADNPNRIEPKITRVITQSNVRFEFDSSNPSFHPVVSTGVNQSVPSLITPMNSLTMIYCTDCHNSDSQSGAQGPHGSIWPNLLKYQYETADLTQESAGAYALCYSCHSRNSIIGDESFPHHNLHLENDIPCSACHDPHGISSVQGTSLNNTHLINFDITIVTADPNTGQLKFEDQGSVSGRCFLLCHEKIHSPLGY